MLINIQTRISCCWATENRHEW